MTACLASGMIAAGRRVADFESSLSQYVGGRAGVATATGTDALVLALAAVGVSAGDEVVLPTYVCRDVMLAVRRLRGTPVLCDVSDAWCSTAADVRACLTDRTRAVIAVDALGIRAPIAEMAALGVPVIEDACQALAPTAPAAGAVARVYSFHATKCLTTGEGGMVVTDDEHLAASLRSFRDDQRFVAPLSDFAASLGIAQLARHPEAQTRRRRLVEQALIRWAPAATQMFAARLDRSALFRLPLWLDADFDAFAAACRDRGVMVRRGVDALLHRALGRPDADFPGAVAAFQHTISVPVQPSLSAEEAERVLRVVDDVCREVLADDPG
ncbi:MAG: DegT/DnrJ/EryC1/StrS family aminotransferase [Myxococcales bacterium]|nr:DegT/DnrJ/EryC1/StrS family aminotransferase [Myxococcales bacterium]